MRLITVWGIVFGILAWALSDRSTIVDAVNADAWTWFPSITLIAIVLTAILLTIKK